MGIDFLNKISQSWRKGFTSYPYFLATLAT